MDESITAKDIHHLNGRRCPVDGNPASVIVSRNEDGTPRDVLCRRCAAEAMGQ